ncbi:NUDIX domain-containing protein [soil metagenome]
MTERPPLPPPHLRDPGDAWVEGPDGQKYWGRFGAAGLLVWHERLGVLLQHRVSWSHFGGTWALPGGARKLGESAFDGALREANEEAGVPADALEVLFTSVLDLGFWSYTTVVTRATREFTPVMGDAESEALSWVPAADVDSLPLHPGFAAAWPDLRKKLVL